MPQPSLLINLKQEQRSIAQKHVDALFKEEDLVGGWLDQATTTTELAYGLAFSDALVERAMQLLLHSNNHQEQIMALMGKGVQWLPPTFQEYALQSMALHLQGRAIQVDTFKWAQACCRPDSDDKPETFWAMMTLPSSNQTMKPAHEIAAAQEFVEQTAMAWHQIAPIKRVDPNAVRIRALPKVDSELQKETNLASLKHSRFFSLDSIVTYTSPAVGIPSWAETLRKNMEPMAQQWLHERSRDLGNEPNPKINDLLFALSAAEALAKETGPSLLPDDRSFDLFLMKVGQLPGIVLAYALDALSVQVKATKPIWQTSMAYPSDHQQNEAATLDLDGASTSLASKGTISWDISAHRKLLDALTEKWSSRWIDVGDVAAEALSDSDKKASLTGRNAQKLDKERRSTLTQFFSAQNRTIAEIQAHAEADLLKSIQPNVEAPSLGQRATVLVL